MSLADRIDTTKVQALLREAAETIVLPRFDSLRGHEIIEKAPGDLVTVADLEAERFLTRELRALLAGSLVVGEEAHSKDPEILRRFEDDGPVWVIDPVDGTKNFTKSSATFCMMVALVERNRPIMGWIHDPLPNRTAIAVDGAGGWLDGQRLTIPEAPPEKDMIGLVNAWYFEEPRRKQVRAEAQARFGHVSSLSCAGQDFLAQAQGKRHFSFYRRLWPWDHAPGALLLREAGGMVERVDGTPYRAGDRVHGLLSAPSAKIWRDLRQFLMSRD
ncbi:MAG: inositol monophosphatase family protein [Alphaproteobacteria bacterium]|nr:inositol monophosphatase family protein [Alphaproteobacteria bacterium]MBO6865287.1 inositol monophosphatase family protein [Alphaproteobacteria bacterium]